MIKKLPVAVVNQIAAGEVVERPSSVVKELVENSIDAGSKSVRVEIAAGGAELIRIIDDGHGFLPEDLPLAFASHATSKLSDVHDLDHIASLGFRGEALASIGAVSRASIRSRRHDADEGWEVRTDGGKESKPAPCGCPVGTTIEIRDLFYNVPARRKFLKTPGAEKARVQETLAELSLARLDVGFTFVADGKEILRLPADASLAERFTRCFGQRLGKGLIPVARKFSHMSVEGIVGEPDLARRDSKLELCYINGRLAREKSAFHAIRQAYREYLMGGRFPIYVLQVSLPPDQVDVNIHPRKAEVRFVDSRAVAGCLHETVRSALGDRGLVQSAGGVVIDPNLPRAKSGFPTAPLPAGLFGDGAATPPAGSPRAFAADPVETVVRDRGAEALAGGDEARPRAGAALGPAGDDADANVRRNPFEHGPQRFLQIMDLYLLLEGPDGLMVVDQHALHERVMYERLQREHASQAVAIQRLVTPAVVEVAPTELDWLQRARESLASAGLLVDQMGPNTVGVHGVPAVLHRVDPEKLVRMLLEGEPGEGRAKVNEQIHEKFHSMACRSAIMSGDRLTQPEIEALLAEAATLEHPHNCPHGRPTVLTFNSAELERYFRRRC
ncbi:MAG: DNA mismatch repair endonuclease MutL [bacterium]|nr:DNA mismatch repair endonuclease MutL [bacterium]